VIHHIDELYPFSCETCGGKFLRRNQLTEHLVTEHPKKPKVSEDNKCDYCFQQFQTAIAKLQHIKVTHADMRYKCRICKSSFSAHKNRARHEVEIHRRNIDNPEQFYECDICGKAYVTIYTMKQHMVSHEK
jgi:DNA-directed RNA polymerase subunit RPC12/RpoP